jgi:hypothetical protein
MTMKPRLTDAELWQATVEAEARKSDSSLPLDARMRSFETFTQCLREAHKRNYDYSKLRGAANAELLREQAQLRALSWQDSRVTARLETLHRLLSSD